MCQLCKYIAEKFAEEKIWFIRAKIARQRQKKVESKKIGVKIRGLWELKEGHFVARGCTLICSSSDYEFSHCDQFAVLYLEKFPSKEGLWSVKIFTKGAEFEDLYLSINKLPNNYR